MGLYVMCVDSRLIEAVSNKNLKPSNYWRSEKTKYYTFRECVFVALGYPVGNAHAPCHLWPARLPYIFLHYLITGIIFGEKKVIEHNMCV